MDLSKKKRQILFTPEEIKTRVEELGKQITLEYKGKNLLVVSILRGSFIFTADLVREIDIPMSIEFMRTSSYEGELESSGNVKILYDLAINIEEYDVLVVDDIADTGLTMKYVLKHLEQKNPTSLRCCVLLDKPDRRKTKLEADFVGFTIPDQFIVGYGLNYGDHYRNEPCVFSFVD